MGRVWFGVYRVKLKPLAMLIVVVALAYIVYIYAIGRVATETISAMSWAVANKVIVVDAGHGGPDGGATGPGGTLEKDINLAVAKKVSQVLSQAGAAVIMTRETDKDLSEPGKSIRERKKEDMGKRAQLANEAKADLYLSIQANSFGSSWTGAQTFYKETSPAGERLAKSIQGELTEVLGNTDRKAKPLPEADSYLLRTLEMPVAIVEVGFISNPKEEKMLNDPVYQQRLAWSVYAGVVKYFAFGEKDGETGR
ncbi:N-acetylmuramoyl-L-alanine amidase CwlD [Metallumcola ferriviriculae]|uniref:N-acetylmuramoyl-L-alanine amidase CwlD n=1 Tax=Metallumcola ferriviriculae TaxID=3039180 RepID=A0AAU0UIY9_9FIRM|nr:N-acetylmuramoyl-L-alanine amidase CwlD [Desulfitibacteraceae bacterium MK1]